MALDRFNPHDREAAESLVYGCCVQPTKEAQKPLDVLKSIEANLNECMNTLIKVTRRQKEWEGSEVERNALYWLKALREIKEDIAFSRKFECKGKEKESAAFQQTAEEAAIAVQGIAYVTLQRILTKYNDTALRILSAVEKDARTQNFPRMELIDLRNIATAGWKNIQSLLRSQAQGFAL